MLLSALLALLSASWWPAVAAPWQSSACMSKYVGESSHVACPAFFGIRTE